MNEVTRPACLPPVVKPDFPVRVPSGMSNPRTEVERPTGHRAGDAISEMFPFQNFVSEFDTNPLISVQAENPFVSCLIGGKVLLAGISIPFSDENASAAAFGDFTGLVGTPGIDDQNLVTTRKTG